MLQRGHDPAPIADPAPPAIQTVPTVRMHPVQPFAVHYNSKPWLGPVGLVPLDAARYRNVAMQTLAGDIGRAAGLPKVAVLCLFDSLPGEYASLLDDLWGWMILGDMIAERLGIFDPDKPLLSYPNETH